jgi:hypothetical protein
VDREGAPRGGEGAARSRFSASSAARSRASPRPRPALLAAAAEALGHEHAGVQECALALLEAHELDERTRAVVLGLAKAVAPTLSPRRRRPTTSERASNPTTRSRAVHRARASSGR